MFTAQELKKHLLGVFEILILIKVGVDRFNSDFSSAMRSFVWPLLVLPVAVFTASLLSPDYSFGSLLALHFVRLLFTYTLSLGLIYILAKKIDRMKYMYQYITVSNWFEIAMLVLVSPVLMFLLSGGVIESIQNYVIFITCLGVVYSGYILTHTLRIPWEFGVLVAVSLLFVQETGFDFVDYVTANYTAL